MSQATAFEFDAYSSLPNTIKFERQIWSKIVPDGITVRLAHFVGRNVNLALLKKFRDRFTFQVDAPSAFI
ncbi:MAG: hypothetical protein CMB79_00865 [Filomicrobium sp.]|nr:hypothetical protein [Filomicrobium sp.]